MGLRTLLTIIGALVASLGVTMLLPAVADLASGNENWRVFVAASFVTTLSGAGLWASSSGRVETLTLRQAFLLTTLIWTVLTFFGSLPLLWSDLGFSFTDAIFEAMAGFTTTGSTVLTGLDHRPPGVLLWRGMMQWFGGLGIVVMAIAVLPALQVGGMQMFKAESFETPDKILPKAGQIAGGMSVAYVVLTALCGIGYWYFGMPPFDAAIHAMTTLATGGFSTSDSGLQAFAAPGIDYVAIVFMLMAATPFALFVGAVQQGRWDRLFGNSQVQGFYLVVAVVSAFVIVTLVSSGQFFGEEAVRVSVFAVVNIMTGTGFTSLDNGSWGTFTTFVFFVLMFVGGCTGSTSCGIKIFRFQVLARDLYQHVSRILTPSRIYIKRYNGAPLPDAVSTSV
ncbi:MAG TPA: TrkH family potassium uptake protein, partial [Devosia sp.]|nr:TrkH family potassium uptake protein [Devosia sp.]